MWPSTQPSCIPPSYSYLISNAVKCPDPTVGIKSPVSVATSIPVVLDTSDTSWHHKSTTDVLAASDEPAQTQLKHNDDIKAKRPIKMENQEQAAREIHDTLAITEPTVKADDGANGNKAIQVSLLSNRYFFYSRREMPLEYQFKN
jgi:enoyl reductase-like protein